ncbi:tetratricopeptide repeat protein [Nonomuraea gerenzanensis]|uniref:WD40-repeat containing protein n=1 Tax=Nonomuraea gerenzanensis TaxID=93944 RepID=A0A1M4DXM1_9ACTN|nr:tetratricopeptide repeat protein [Nonomuraea gerenzanensis]UBU13642.1 tetratricopeptide repeat protein [Nonomuraea gerenzanensis]SBO91308.1 WD40-repeat containing protein [Nonomuraea gerenzanensis]
MPELDPHVHPYVGLRPYRREESALFHGREREAQEVATLWQATGLTVLYGASGVGKTSLLHAGVLPLLDPERADVLPVARIGSHLAPSESGGNPYVVALLSSWEPELDARRPASLTISEYLRRRPERTDLYGDPVPMLAAVDQAEEIFHGSPRLEKERKVFLEQLATAVRTHPGLHVLLSLREEYLFLVLPYERPIGQGSRARFHLHPLTPEKAKEAVRKPLIHTHRTITRAAADLLIDELRTVDYVNEIGETSTIQLDTVEPIQLQVVCSALWESLPAEVTEITEDHARLYAQVEEFLFEFYKRTIADVAREHRVPANEIRFWMRNVFITEHGTRNAVYEGLRTTQGMPNEVVRALEDRHLLRAEQRLGIRWYELTHDRLIGPVSRSDAPESSLREARLALQEQNWEGARRLADAAVRAADAGASWVRAEAAEIFASVAAARGEIHTARKYCEEAAGIFAERQRFDGVARALTADGLLWLAQGDPTRAIERISAALNWAPNDVAARIALAEALLQSGTPKAADAIISGLPSDLAQQTLKKLRDPT